AGGRRQWRFWQRAFQIVDKSRAAQRQSRTGRRGALDLAAAEIDRGRGTGGTAQRRQVDLSLGGQCCETEDRRLSVHHTTSAARRGEFGRPRIRAGGYSGPDRRRA